MAISKLKQRYSVALTPANVNRFKGLCAKMHMPPSAMSNLFDDTLNTVSATFEAALSKGSMEISDLFRVMGQQMQLLEDDAKLIKKEEGKNAVSRQKRNPVPKQ